MVKLPAVPAGRELEDFVAASYQCNQHFVEKSIEEQNILELDIVVTDYSPGTPTSSMIEVKGKQARFTDLFKVLGWMRYLNIESAKFVSTKPPGNSSVDLVNEKFKPLGLELIVLSDVEDVPGSLTLLGASKVNELDHEIWRFSFWIERRYVQLLHNIVHSEPNCEGAAATLDYYNLINSGIFFSQSPIERVSRLYEAFKEHPQLTGGVAAELDGLPFDPTLAPDSSPTLKAALYDGKHPLVHASMFVEHRARLSILKAAVDYLLELKENASGFDSKAKAELELEGLPASFVEALSELESLPEFWLYPVFWQVFLWGWGGLLVKDLGKADLGGLMNESGLSETSLRSAFRAFDLLFPLEHTSWIREMSSAAYKFVIMVPWGFQAMGALRRLTRSGKKSYSELGLSGQYTTNDLVRRHNAGVALLKST